ncbi:MAG: hypothetical protein IKP37_10370 [Paludibacteraceae bacterium]|nr:hypothetical protein [Paludibacteraceae bacterium]
MIYFVYLIVVAFSVSMFKAKPGEKVGIMMLTSICFDAVVVEPIPVYRRAKMLMVLALLLSEWKNLKFYYKDIHNYAITKYVSVLLASFVIMCLTSPHILNGDFQLWRLIVEQPLTYTCLPLYIFCVIKDKDNLDAILKYVYYALIVVTVFGLLNFITKHSLFMDILGSVSKAGENVYGDTYANMDRFRVQSMFTLACDYGNICTMYLILIIYGYSVERLSKIQLIVAVACCVTGILICGFRTCIVCALMSIVIFFLVGYKIKSSVKYFLLGTILTFLCYITIPVVHDKIDNAMTAFTASADETDGSSIEMRMMQLAAVFFHIEGHELTGCGYGYFLLDMGWGDGGYKTLIDKDLYGLEGMYLKLLLHQGYVGLFSYLIFIFGIMIYAYKNIDDDRLTAAYLMSSVAIYFLYANMTGEQSSTYSAMIAIGLGMKLIELQRTGRC